MTANGYRRLPGGLSGFVRRASAWAGEDHLLLISGTRYHERYNRVYYGDILAIVVQRCMRFTVPWQLLMVIFVLLFSAITPSARALLFSLVGILLVVLIGVCVAFSCRVVIATAVGNVPVPGVSTIWEASLFLKKLAPQVEEAQRPANPPTEVPPQ